MMGMKKIAIITACAAIIGLLILAVRIFGLPFMG